MKIINATKKYKKGKLIEETKTEIDWKLREADLDIVLVGCECGNQYDLPYDCIGFMNSENGQCGQCGESGKMSVIADPSPNKEARPQPETKQI